MCIIETEQYFLFDNTKSTVILPRKWLITTLNIDDSAAVITEKADRKPPPMYGHHQNAQLSMGLVRLLA